MSAQHTPGPWRVMGSVVGEREHYVVAPTHEVVAWIRSVQPQSEANGLLIAAAPELLAALRIALRAPGIHTTDQETGEVFSDVINAAIAKAEGDQS